MFITLLSYFVWNVHFTILPLFPIRLLPGLPLFAEEASPHQRKLTKLGQKENGLGFQQQERETALTVTILNSPNHGHGSSDCHGHVLKIQEH